MKKGLLYCNELVFSCTIWIIIYLCLSYVCMNYIKEDAINTIKSIMPSKEMVDLESIQKRQDIDRNILGMETYFKSKVKHHYHSNDNKHIYQLEEWAWLIEKQERNDEGELVETMFYPTRIYSNGKQLGNIDIIEALQVAYDKYENDFSQSNLVSSTKLLTTREKLRKSTSNSADSKFELKAKFPKWDSSEYISVGENIVVSVRKSVIEEGLSLKEFYKPYKYILFFVGLTIFVFVYIKTIKVSIMGKQQKYKFFFSFIAFSIFTGFYTYQQNTLQKKTQRILADNFDEDMNEFYPKVAETANHAIYLKTLELAEIQNATYNNNINFFICHRINELYSNSKLRTMLCKVDSQKGFIIMHNYVKVEDKLRYKAKKLCEKISWDTEALTEMNPFDIENSSQLEQHCEKCDSLIRNIRLNLSEFNSHYDYMFLKK